jgi:hypothetical protein
MFDCNFASGLLDMFHHPFYHNQGKVQTAAWLYSTSIELQQRGCDIYSLISDSYRYGHSLLEEARIEKEEL